MTSVEIGCEAPLDVSRQGERGGRERKKDFAGLFGTAEAVP